MRLQPQMSEAVKRLNPDLNIVKIYPPPKDYIEEAASIPTKQDLKNEKAFQNQVCALLRNRGIVYARSRMDQKTGNTLGLPDFLFAFNGRPIAWELKMPGKELSDDQKICVTKMASNGWDVKVLFTIDDVLKELTDMGAKELT